MNKIFLIGGIGCGDAIFEKITPPMGYLFDFIPWIEPLNGENITQYVHRMTKDICFGEKDIILGVSLGGMVAQILLEEHPKMRCIIISSAVSMDEFSPFLRFVKRFSLHKIIPARLFTIPAVVSFLVTGSVKKRHVKALKHLLAGMSKEYFRFMIAATMDFMYFAEDKSQIMRLHGSKDALFPVKTLVMPSHIISGATHLAVYTHGRVVSKILEELLS